LPGAQGDTAPPPCGCDFGSWITISQFRHRNVSKCSKPSFSLLVRMAMLEAASHLANIYVLNLIQINTGQLTSRSPGPASQWRWRRKGRCRK